MKTASTGQLFFGLLVVALGLGFLLDALNLVDFGSVINDWWPLLIIGVGIASYLSNPRQVLWPAIIVIAGLLLILRELGIVNFNVWSLIWPALLIIFGLNLLFKWSDKKEWKEFDKDKVDIFVAFSGNQARSTTHTFKGGKATALFGGIELDLTDAQIKKSATLDIFTAFGGVDIRVPDGWEIKTSGLPVFGGWEDKTRNPKVDKGAPVLHIAGTCIFGGVSIKN